ncbi:two-component system, sensor protein [Alloactinosynnema sp. L-07]|nr:two-component system, sensor protein [Alloactinosynnema sp. L-07]
MTTAGRRDPIWMWDVYFAVGLAGVLVFVMVAKAPPAERIAAMAALVALGAWHVLYGRPMAIVTGDRRRGNIFIVGLLVLFFTAVGFVQMSTYALFIVCPMVFMSTSFAMAAPIVGALNIIPPFLGAWRSGAMGEIHGLLPASFLGLAFSILIGFYINRITDESDERAALITELERSRAEVARLSHEAGVSAERTRLAGEIHDTLAQGFTSIVTLVQAAESAVDRDSGQVRRNLDLAARTARENLAEARALVAALAPTALADGTLADALRRQVDRLAETGVRAAFQVDGAGEIPTGVEVLLLRAAQEAIANVRKHARADSVTVHLGHTDEGVTLRISDNGVGFDPGAATDGYGLRGMRARAAQFSAVAEVVSAPGAGTTVTLAVPR